MNELFATPLAMVVGTVVGFALSVLTQLLNAKHNDAVIDGAFLRSYFLTHWVETVVALLGAGVLFVLAVESDQLNMLSAVLAGYTGNSIADLLTSKFSMRSRLIGNQDKPEGE